MTVHCWPPDEQLLGAAALLFPLPGSFLLFAAYELFGLTLPLPLTLVVEAGLLLLALWYCCCRLVVTPQTAELLSSGFWKKTYACPLERVMLAKEGELLGSWLLGQSRQPGDYQRATLAFNVEEDWDTGAFYVNITSVGTQLLNGFRVAQYGEISQALTNMAACRHTSQVTTSSSDDHA